MSPRRDALAEQKIGLAERDAVNEVRAKAVDIAIEAARAVLGEQGRRQGQRRPVQVFAGRPEGAHELARRFTIIRSRWLSPAAFFCFRFLAMDSYCPDLPQISSFMCISLCQSASLPAKRISFPLSPASQGRGGEPGGRDGEGELEPKIRDGDMNAFLSPEVPRGERVSDPGLDPGGDRPRGQYKPTSLSLLRRQQEPYWLPCQSYCSPEHAIKPGSANRSQLPFLSGMARS